jgi:uncharacterized protein (DUF362 family)
MIERDMKYRAFLGNLHTAGYYDLIREGLRYIGFGNIVPENARIFIKPNLTYPTYRPGVMTSLAAIEAAITAIQEYNPRELYIGDADSGGYKPFSMGDVYREIGLWKLAEKYNVKVVNLSKLERKTIFFQYLNRNFSIELPRLLTDEIDISITMPVPKVHSNTGVSLTFKNQWGCIPEPKDRLRLHPYLKHVLLEVNRAVRCKVAIIDGKYGLNINGPMKGSPVEMNWVLITNDIGAGARLACELMQIPLTKIRHLKYARNLGFIPVLEEIDINQNIQSFVKERFTLQRKWTDYPGVLAFYFPILAYTAYFSPLAELLHRILYVFREPFYKYNN